MADFTIKRGDTFPFLRAVLSDANGPVDLTGATVKVILKTPGLSGTVVVNDVCTITNAANGIVEYEWDPADTATVNTLDAEWQVTWADAEVTTFPNEGFKSVAITQDLAD